MSRSRVWILKDLPLLTRIIVKGDGSKIFLQIEIRTERLKNNVYFDKHGIGVYL